jgi:hypothetical protein
MEEASVKRYGGIAVLLVTLLMLSTVVVSADIGNNQQASQNGGIDVTIPIGTYEITNTSQGQRISIENLGRLLIPGKPDLPSKIFTIAIPPGAEVSEVTFEAGESITLPGIYKISPVPLPRVIGQEDPLIYAQDKKMYEENFNAVYGKDDPYPQNIVEFVGPAGYRKYNLADVRVTPFTYRPLSGQLIYYPQITVRVSYTIPEDFSIKDVMMDNLPQTEQIAREFILDYDQAESWYPKAVNMGKGLHDFVIITLDALTSSVTPLVDWETSKGRTVEVVTTSWISSNYTGYDLAEKMRNFLRDKYPSEQWGIQDVLLVGHRNDVPMRRTYQDEGYGQPETDYYYAELSSPDSLSWDKDKDHKWGENSDPIDFYAEVNVGRIPWSSSAEVLHICEKSVAYEQNQDPAFKKNILLLGAFFWDDTDNAVLMEAKAGQTWMLDWTKTRMYEQGSSSYPMNYDLKFNNVRSVWSAGKFAFVDWAGHGSYFASYILYSTGEAFVSTSTCPYLNDDYPSIIFADACSNSDTDYPNIGRAMLKQGGVGFLGATKAAYGMGAWSDSSDGSSQSLDYFFTTRVTSGNYTQGQAHQWALRKMYTSGLWYSVKYEMFEWGALWGNPNLKLAIGSNPPLVPDTPSGPTEGEVGTQYTFSTNTADPEGDSIFYLYSWGDGTDSDWLGPYNSGDTCVASKVWMQPTLSYVKAKAKDANGLESSWSDSLSVAIFTRGDCTGDEVVDAGDVVSLVNYLFIGGPAPYPIQSADVNCDGEINSSDVVYLINYLFISGPPPCSQK